MNADMDRIASALCALLLEGAARATIALAVAGIAAWILRRASAAVRHLAWASALFASLMIPALLLILPPWPIAIPVPSRPAGLSPAMPDAAGPGGARLAEVDVTEVSPPIPRAGSPAETISETAASSRAVSPAVWLVTAWGLGAGIVAAPVLVARWRLRRWRTTEDGAGIDSQARRLAQSLGSSRRVRILLGDAVASPMTWGICEPVILLPSAAGDWPEDRLRPVLLHELAHVARYDCLTQLVGRLAYAVFWFHPLVWLAAQQQRRESELACDDLVLGAGTRALDYAACLLSVASSLRDPDRFAAAAIPMARTSQLEGRVRAILDASRPRRGITRRGVLLMSTVAAVLVFPTATAHFSIVNASAGAPERPDGGEKAVVSGRVLTPDGKPVPGAKVAIVGRRQLSTLSARTEMQESVMGRSQADARGEYRIEIPRPTTVSHYDVHAFAVATGYAMGWSEIVRSDPAPRGDITLRPESTAAGKLVDDQGRPAAGIALQVTAIGVLKPRGQGRDGIGFSDAAPAELGDIWPARVTSGADGVFRIPGVGPGCSVWLTLNDPRFGEKNLSLKGTGQANQGPEELVLHPGMKVSGRVTQADTGSPLKDAFVEIHSGANLFNGARATVRTDADGRYEVGIAPGSYVAVTAYPPSGSPYLVFQRNEEKHDPKRPVVLDLPVPRGVLMTGTVTERGTGRVLPRAGVYYVNGKGNVVQGQGTIPGWMAAVSADAEGRYAIAVTPGKGHLLYYGPAAEFVYEVMSDRELRGAGIEGQRNYAHAFRSYDVKKGDGPVSMDVDLTPGLTLRGNVVGPDGRPVAAAEIISTLYISPFHTSWRGDFTIPVRDGRFEIHGFPPDRGVKCSFLDATHGWGATIELTPAMAKEPPTVRLLPGGTATARIVDERGTPVEKDVAHISIVAAPGHGSDFYGKTLTEKERGEFMADETLYVNIDRVNYWEGPRSDRDGRITMPRLIPGATYRIYELSRSLKEPPLYRWRDFTVDTGKTIDLGEIRTQRNPVEPIKEE